MFKPLWIMLAKWGAVIGAVIWTLFKVRQSGTEAEKRKEAMDTLKGVQESAKIDNYIASVKPDKLEQLRQRFNRD